MLDSNDVLQPNFVVLLLWLILILYFLQKEDHSQRFRRLSLRFHPERIAADNGCEEAKASSFAVVAEAYEVLSDPLKRAIYDQYGEDGLKRDFRAPDGCVKPYVYHGQPLRTYREFFGTENPYADLLDTLANPKLQDCPEAPAKKKDEPIVRDLPLTLSEVFYGGIKRIKIERLVLVGDDCDCKETSGLTTTEEKILSVPIMPGMPSGAEIVFPEEGDQGPAKIPADIVFVTVDKAHETFKREGSNLRMTVDVFLSEALTGTIVTVNTIDGRILRVPITSVISPGYVKTIRGEGLPRVEDANRRGDLVIHFNVEFPSYLSPESKAHVSRAFESDLQETENKQHAKYALQRPMVLDGKVYMRANKLAEICSP